MKYKNKFVKTFSFLENYGFILSIDPQNGNRLCYKNDYGEIVMSNKKEDTISSNTEIYVQVKGRKTVIDVKTEYKNNLHKSTIGKSIVKMFEELFIYKIKQNRKFYGIFVREKKIESNDTILDIDRFEDPVRVYNHNRLNNFLLSLIIILPFVQVIFIIISHYNKLTKIFNIINASVILIIHLIVIKLMKRNLNILSKVLLLIYPILLFVSKIYFPRRDDYLVVMISFILLVILLVLYLCLFCISKNKKMLFNGIIPMIYPFIVLFIYSFTLNDYVYLTSEDLGVYLLVGATTSLIATIIIHFIIKDKAEKKNYFGLLIGIFCMIFFTTTFTPYFTFQNLTYSLDQSVGVECQYKVIDKNTARSSGRYKSTIYRLYINKDDKKELLSVPEYIYEMYDIGDYIELYKHNGYFDSEYYEYVIDN